MGNTCCCKDKDSPTFSFKDCLQNINIKSSCFSSCCVKGDSKIENHKTNQSKHQSKHHSKHHKKDNN
jgi:hypothetical protein